MELACYLKRMSIEALVEWAPSMSTGKPTSSHNGDFHCFDPSRRIPIEPGSLRWDILDEALSMGEAKGHRENEARECRNKSRRPEDRLRVTDL